MGSGRRAVRTEPCRTAEDGMSNCEAETEALTKLLNDARSELERAKDERERHTLGLYCEYLEARLARLRTQPNLC